MASPEALRTALLDAATTADTLAANARAAAGPPTGKPIPPDRIALEVGKRLRQVREGRHLTLCDVAAKTGGSLSAASVGAWERGSRGVSLPKLAELAAFYGVSIHSLIPEGVPGAPRARGGRSGVRAGQAEGRAAGEHTRRSGDAP